MPDAGPRLSGVDETPDYCLATADYDSFTVTPQDGSG